MHGDAAKKQPTPAPSLLAFALAALLGAAPWTAGARAQEAGAEPPPTPDERIESIDQRIRILERQRELEKDEEAEKAKGAAKVKAGADGFSLQSADGSFQLRIRGYVQFDGRFWSGDEEKPAIDTFVLRRVRPIFEGRLYQRFDFRIMPDFGEGRTVLQDAYMDVKFTPAARVRADKFKPPVGLERLQSGADLLFVERSLPTNLVPNRDLGVQLFGEVLDGSIAYAGGIFNGVPDGSSADVDTNDSKEGAARVFFQPFKRTTLAGLQGLGIGFAATHGTNEGTVAATGLAGFRTAGQQTFFAYLADNTAAGTVVADGRRLRLSPQLLYYWGRFGLQGEYVRSSQAVLRGAAEADLEHAAWQGSASFMLTRDAASWKTIVPRKPIGAGRSGPGAFEIAVRAARLRADDDAFPTFANPAASARAATEHAAGINWYLNRNFRVMVDYVRTRFDGGAPVGDREEERIVFSRFQVAF